MSRLLLVAVFLVAALAKVIDQPGSRKSLIGFGIPSILAYPLAILLPLSELAVSISLLPTSTAWWGCLGALTLLVLFSIVISFNLAQGRKPDCHCFGQLSAGPIGWHTLVRNSILGIPAGFIALRGSDNVGPSLFSLIENVTIGERVLIGLGGLIIALVLFILWLLIQLTAQNGRLLLRVEALEVAMKDVSVTPLWTSGYKSSTGLPIGSLAPEFQLRDLNGEMVSLARLGVRGKPSLMVFVDPDCGPCKEVVPDLSRWEREFAGTVTLSVIAKGHREATHLQKVGQLRTILFAEDGSRVTEAYRVSGTPTAVLIMPDGTIGSSLAEGPEDIRKLMARVMSERSESKSGVNDGKAI